MRPLAFLKPYDKTPFPKRYAFMEPIMQSIVRERFSPEEINALDGLVSGMKLAAALAASGVDPDERLLVALTHDFEPLKFEPWCDRVASGEETTGGQTKVWRARHAAVGADFARGTDGGGGDTERHLRRAPRRLG